MGVLQYWWQGITRKQSENQLEWLWEISFVILLGDISANKIRMKMVMLEANLLKKLTFLEFYKHSVYPQYPYLRYFN